MNILAKYHDEKGSVFISKEDNAFFVVMQKKNGPGVYHCYTKGFYDFEEAIDEYKACIDKLYDKVADRVCVVRQNRHCKCSAKNCPKKLGGKAYWQLFRDACLFRTR